MSYFKFAERDELERLKQFVEHAIENNYLDYFFDAKYQKSDGKIILPLFEYGEISISKSCYIECDLRDDMDNEVYDTACNFFHDLGCYEYWADAEEVTEIDCFARERFDEWYAEEYDDEDDDDDTYNIAYYGLKNGVLTGAVRRDFSLFIAKHFGILKYVEISPKLRNYRTAYDYLYAYINFNYDILDKSKYDMLDIIEDFSNKNKINSNEYLLLCNKLKKL